MVRDLNSWRPTLATLVTHTLGEERAGLAQVLAQRLEGAGMLAESLTAYLVAGCVERLGEGCCGTWLPGRGTWELGYAGMFASSGDGAAAASSSAQAEGSW